MSDDAHVSEAEAAVFLVLKKNGDGWMSNEDISAKEPNVPERTIRSITARLFDNGVLERAETHPGHHFRVSQTKGKVLGAGYKASLEKAVQVFGLK